MLLNLKIQIHQKMHMNFSIYAFQATEKRLENEIKIVENLMMNFKCGAAKMIIT